ncbi:long-chain-fatty-acid--CoA ligase [Lentibacillus daqui]|uniref:long-chain-fatty-acid--CoA ligase n=1 Tax=Lentibacillus daqui TaxID=2911514 RepID=UPI0022B16D20|nr:long-chain fatty acid--CoA ligase [Lentibacillus daqui]
MNEAKERPWEKYYTLSLQDAGSNNISLYEFFNTSAKKYATRTAITFREKTITYEELKNKIDHLAGNWGRMGFKQGERIGLMIQNHPDYIVSYYAAHALGLIVVQINPSYTARELLQIVTDVQLTYILADPKSIETVQAVKDIYPFQTIVTSQLAELELDKQTHQLKALTETGEKLNTPVAINAEDDVAVIQYTGGTTGKMKGAMLTHKNLVTNVIQSFIMYRENLSASQDTVLAATPLYHVYAMTGAMNLGIFMGANILLVTKFKVDEVMPLIKKHQPTVFPGVPQMYIAFVNYPDAEKYGLDCFRVCSCGSAPLPVEILNKFEKLTGSKISEGFGMSETSPTTHRTPVNGEVKPGSVGIPVPETDSKIIDNNQNELGLYEVGELVVKGPQVMKGYWNNETETNRALQNGWMHTGDLAMQDEDGYFYIVGRKKEMVITGGFNIYPQEIEGVLYQHPYVKEAAVAGIPDPEKGEIVKAYIVPKEEYSIDVEELKGFCYRNLTPYKVPKQFELRESLPRNTVGKILKRKLIESEKS